MSSRKVIDVQVGKDSKVVCKFAGQLEVNGGDRSKIENVCIDMSGAFIRGVEDTFPNASITLNLIRRHCHGILEYFNSRIY